tara:strand:+ start:189 stop:539 length:351 start_codon:yes stop_codon:yes gene_type:complete
MVDKTDEKPSKLKKLLDDMIAEIDSWPKLDEWDGILDESQRCDGLYPEFADAEIMEKIANMNPCSPIVGFKKAITGFHVVPREHPDYPKIWYLCQDCDEIWNWQMYDDKGVPARKW